MTFTTTFILAKIAPVFLLLLLGAVIRGTRMLPAAADASLMRITVRVLYPALILKFILGNEAVLDSNRLWTAPAAGFTTIAAGFLLGWLVSRWLPPRHERTRRSFALTTGIYNYGYIPIPIVLALFGDGSGATIGVLLLHNVGVEAAFWTLGVALLSAGKEGGAWKRIFNPPTLTLLVAMTLNLTGTYRLVPGFAVEAIDWLAACTIPFGLILAGATLADLLKEERGLFREARVPALACLLRLGLLPLLFLVLARYLPGLSEELRRVLVVQAAMPAGIFPIVVNRYYGGDSRTAVQVVLGTTLVGIVTIPLWLRFGLEWVF